MTSEPRTETDMEDLRLVERFLLDWQADIELDRADRRFPCDTDPGRGADPRRIQDHRLHPAGGNELRRRQHDVLLVVRPQAAEIAPDPAVDPEFLRQPERDGKLQRTDIIFV